MSETDITDFDISEDYLKYDDKYNNDNQYSEENIYNESSDSNIVNEIPKKENNKNNKKLKPKLEMELETDSYLDWDKDDKDYGYPKIDDENFQSKIYKKREFYYYKIPERPNLDNYKEIEEFRKKICIPSGQLLEHQALLSNFINPETPYKGLLVFHGTGTGKTCAAIAIGEKFKQQVQRYGMQIYILVPGPLLKESWREHFIKCTGDTYLRQNENLIYLNEEEKDKIKRQAIQNALQYYKVMSYRSFYRKVLGEKIIEKKVIEGNKIKVSYKKTEEGDFERDISMDRLHNINNSLIIVD
jgi:hypothetical protein